MKQKPPKTHRSDLVCKTCGQEFTGHVARRYCDACKQAKDAPREPAGDPATGSEMEVEAKAPPEPQHDPAYRKKIHVDPNRPRFDSGRRRGDGDSSSARSKAADAISKESAQEAKRKAPLRAKLTELQVKRDGFTAEVNSLDEEILKVLAEIGTPQADRELIKKCFGRYDPDDFECTSLCPLQPECEVKARRSPIGEGEPVAAPASARTASEAP